MKPIFLFSAALLFSIVLVAQAKKEKQAPPAWGHYKKLSAISTAAQSENAGWDTLHFILAKGETTDLGFSGNQPGEVIGNGKKRAAFYLTGKEKYNIAAPPANSSLQTRAELDYLLQLQARRSEEDLRASAFYAGVYYRTGITPNDKDYARFQCNLFHIGRSVATWFNADSLPLTAKLAANTWKDAEYIIWKYKNHFIRIRPYKLETKLENKEETNWAAYPSGHSSNSYVNAFLFSELLPEFTSFFMKDAYDMAHSREIIGVHYPSDSESGRLMARELINHLLKNENFKRDFDAAKKEIETTKRANGF